jgi:hypothetical protein
VRKVHKCPGPVVHIHGQQNLGPEAFHVISTTRWNQVQNTGVRERMDTKENIVQSI